MKYTVIGFYDNGQIFSHILEAQNATEAFKTIAKAHEFATLVAALKGEVKEEDGISFPGSCITDADSYLHLTGAVDGV